MGFSFTSLFGENEAMSGSGLEAIIREISDRDVQVNASVIEFGYDGVALCCIYDESHDRMRIIAPIKQYADVSDEEKDSMLESNFHSALDARYCMSNGVVYSAYIHPLSPLKKDAVVSGIYQVVSLHISFGEAYSSGLLSFGGAEE